MGNRRVQQSNGGAVLYRFPSPGFPRLQELDVFEQRVSALLAELPPGYQKQLFARIMERVCASRRLAAAKSGGGLQHLLDRDGAGDRLDLARQKARQRGWCEAGFLRKP